MNGKNFTILLIRYGADTFAVSMRMIKGMQNAIHVVSVLDLQAGHFMSRRYHATRYDYDNTRVQCYSCNVGLHGNQYYFSVRLNTEHKSKASAVAARIKNKPPSIDQLKQLRAVLKLSLQRLPDDYWIRPKGTGGDSTEDN